MDNTPGDKLGVWRDMRLADALVLTFRRCVSSKFAAVKNQMTSRPLRTRPVNLSNIEIKYVARTYQRDGIKIEQRLPDYFRAF